MFAGENISARFVVPTVASSVDLVVHLGTGPDGTRRVGTRRVEEVAAVPGRVENDVIEIEPILVRQHERLVRTQGMPPRPDRYDRHGIDVRTLLNGPS
jgi:pilus assembly protein CpaF